MSPPPRPSNIEDFEHHLDGLYWHGWHRPRLSGEPMVLLLHGTGADRSSWGPLLDALPVTWGVIAPDLPGHGQTQFDRRQSLGLREMAVLSQRLLKAMGMRHVDMVVGHSAGAAVGLVMGLDEREMPCGRLYGLAPSLVPPPAFYTQMLGPLLGPLVLSSPSLLMLGGLARSSLVVAACWHRRAPPCLKSGIRNTSGSLQSLPTCAVRLHSWQPPTCPLFSRRPRVLRCPPNYLRPETTHGFPPNHSRA